MKKKEEKYILWFNEVTKDDLLSVGGKNASLGEMIQELSPKGINIPSGFALTTEAYRRFIEFNKIDKKLEEVFEEFDPESIKSLQKTGKAARKTILEGEFPEDLKEKTLKAYQELSQEYKGNEIDVAVRSSGVSEDLPSVAQDEPVLVKFNGEIIYTTIEDLYKKWKETPPEERELFTLSLEETKVKWCPVEEIYRHPVRGRRLVKISTKSGREISITPDHSLLVLDPDDFKLEVTGIDEINEETRIPTIKKIPLKEKNGKSTIEVEEIIQSKPLLIEDGKVRIKEGLWKKQKSFPSKIKINKDFAYFLGIYAAEGSTYGKSCVDISCESEVLADKVKKYLKDSFNLSSSPDRKNVRVFNQSLVAILHELGGFPLDKKGKGRFARTKKVPTLIFNQPEEIIGEFLKGCFDGDGHVSKEGTIEYSSVSSELLGGIIKLLESLGIRCWITKSDTLTIPVSEGKAFLEKIGFVERKRLQRLKEALKRYKNRELYHEFNDTVPPSKRISELLEQKLKPTLEREEVEVKVCPKCGSPMVKHGTNRAYKGKEMIQQYYCKKCNFYPTERTNLPLKSKTILRHVNYDEKGHFEKGAIPWNKGNRTQLITYGTSHLRKIAKRIESKELLKIANSDVIWDEIKEAKPIEYSGYVYDFVVPETQNFAAGVGGVITHNTASFAGQFETFLNVKGEEELLKAIKKCLASSFNDRVIAYREDKEISHLEFALSVGVQKMVRSDLASSGVMFTLDTETGFEDVVLINSVFGVGEMIVKGKITPDEFYVHKPTLKKDYKSIITKNLGKKSKKLIYKGKGGLKEVKVPKNLQLKFSLTEEEVLTLAKWACQIEEHYGAAQDIEWAKDGETGQLFIVQSRPETVHTPETKKSYKEYEVKAKKEPLLKGIAIGEKIGQGKVHIIPEVSKLAQFKKGEVLVTEMTDPDWVSVFPMASAIVTDEGGKTCHAAIVSRELGVPCIVGTKKATKVLKTGQEVTVDCTQGLDGRIFEGKVPFKEKEYNLEKIPDLETKILVNIGAPEIAFKSSFLPVDGVGLAREEFIIAEKIRVHPLALYHFDKIKNQNAKVKKIIEKIEEITVEHKDKREYFVKELAEGIAQIGAAFYPKEVIVRFSDFKTSEYRNLIGGELFEEKEPNPMLGFRGASRYLDKEFQPAFKMECEAIKRAREVFGLKNISVMVPFCRTVQEGKAVLDLIKKYGLVKDTVFRRIVPNTVFREQNLGKVSEKLRVYVMCEVPSNVILADKFSELFDFYSIGSNDLTQGILGLDRDNAKIAYIGDERNDAVKRAIAEFIKKAHKYGAKVSICGEAPASVQGFVEFLIKNGIDSISVNPESVIRTILKADKIERELKR